MQDLVIFFLKEIAAEVKGQGSLHDTGGAMKTPLQEFQPDITADINGGIMQYITRILLDLADKPSEENGVHCEDQVGTDKHGIDQHIFLPFPAGVTLGHT